MEITISRGTGSQQDRYLSGGKIMGRSGRGKLQRIIGGVFSAFILIGGTGVLIENKEPESFSSNLIIFLCFLAIGVFVLYLGLKNKKLVTAARRYASLFAADRDGIATVRELAEKTAKPAETVLKELDHMFNLGLFQNCTLDKNPDHPAVVLSDAQLGQSGPGFINVKCPNCGGTTRIRYGTVGKCDWCGSPIKGED